MEKEFQSIGHPTNEPASSDFTENAGAELNRRHFIKLLGGGLAVVCVLPDAFSTQKPEIARAYWKKLPVQQIGAWLHIGPDGQATVYTGKVEVGQNIRTSLIQVVAEELRLPMDKIKMVMGDTDLVPPDFGTVGSRTTPVMGTQLRKAAAAAREMLLELAAKQWQTQKENLQIRDGQVVNNRNQKLSFGQLTKGQQLVQTLNEQITLTPPEQWQLAGTSVARVNGRDFVTGRHQYVSDLKLPGQLVGKILRPPSFGATLVTADLKQAQALAGVVVVQEGNFLGVAAADLATAKKALGLIKAEWKEKPGQPSRQEIFTWLKQNASGGGNNSSAEQSELIEALGQADKTAAEAYRVDYIAHAPLEPRAALAQWENGKLTVWTGTQRPFGVQDDLARLFSLEKEKVRVIMPDTGGAFGGKHSGEAALEAARLSKAAGKPVKLTWTREEEFTWAYFRPAGLVEVKAGVKNDGTLVAWALHNYNSGPSGIKSPYQIAHNQSLYHPVNSPLKQGSYRGLASTANIFVIESHMDDLAHLVGMDPLAFRLHNLKNERLRAVFEAAAKSFNWGKTKAAPGHGIGIGGGTEKGGFTATCAEVSVNSQSGEVKVLRLTTAFECGAVIHPLHLENQILGSVVQGLGGALFEAILFEDGRILNPKFSQYRVPRFKDMPKIEIIQLNRKDLPSAGAGEAPIVGIAPAIRNAIAAATGVRLKTLPLVPDGLTASVK